jgi:hypothetical protein
MSYDEHAGGLQDIAVRGDYVATGTTWSDEVVVYAPVQGTNWVVVSHAPRSEAYALRSLVTRNYATLVGVALLGFLFLGVTVGRNTVRSLRHIRDNAESLAGGDSLYPPSVLLLLVQETHRALGWKLVLHVFGAGLFMYGWLRCLDRSRAASLLGGLAYLMAPFMVTLVYPGHDGKLFVTALTPLLFWTVEWAFRGRGLGRWTAVSGVIGLIILTTHFQMAYFLFGATGIYALSCTV